MEGREGGREREKPTENRGKLFIPHEELRASTPFSDRADSSHEVGGRG